MTNTIVSYGFDVITTTRKLSAYFAPISSLAIYIVTPYVNYCCPVWGKIGKSLSYKLQKLQNKAARIVTLSDYKIHSRDLLDGLGWERFLTKLTIKTAGCTYDQTS